MTQSFSFMLDNTAVMTGQKQRLVETEDAETVRLGPGDGGGQLGKLGVGHKQILLQENKVIVKLLVNVQWNKTKNFPFILNCMLSKENLCSKCSVKLHMWNWWFLLLLLLLCF